MWNPLYELMESEEIDAEKLAEELRNSWCHFVVLRKTANFKGDLEKQEWKVIYETENYFVYVDETNIPK